MSNILIELILTNQCNKRCEYCDLDFRNKSLSYEDLDLFIDFLSKNKAHYTINFFGGEPLLEFEKLKYFLEKSKKYVTRFTIGTNGLLLNKEKLDFFKTHDVYIYLSIDNIVCGKDLNLNLIKDYEDIININFINDPDYLTHSIYTYKQIISYGFRRVSFMPVYTTKKWSSGTLKLLNLVYHKVIQLDSSVQINSFSYYNGFTSDKQFILDTDAFFYSDLDSLLWLQKQYDILNRALVLYINKQTKLLNLYDNDLSLQKLSLLYNSGKILELTLLIPKLLGYSVYYKVIDRILNTK